MCFFVNLPPSAPRHRRRRKPQADVNYALSLMRSALLRAEERAARLITFSLARRYSTT